MPDGSGAFKVDGHDLGDGRRHSTALAWKTQAECQITRDFDWDAARQGLSGAEDTGYPILRQHGS
jgi:hypothetical protein